MMIIHFVYLLKKISYFLGWIFVTYGIDLVPIPRYSFLVSYRSQNRGIEPSLVGDVDGVKLDIVEVIVCERG